ncbi:unnamed protein product [Rotaria sp. Silwood1]|nr:unnamed protein product [Rotaria sp. Silwood1]CAF3813440.1 unnamed protein product [Rotaria sp. Silwood1]CAF4748452.1 unnamed protein product [Rotaria sp. Silwood1]CAF4789458.1 unnamed protein product [Rotaria sp. Silwood1]
MHHHSNSSKRSSGGKSIDKCSSEYLQGLEKCKNAIREIENNSHIDFDCDEPLPLDWSDLPDNDDMITSDASSMVNLFNKKPDTNEQKPINAGEDLSSSPQRQHSKCTKGTNIKSKRQCASSRNDYENKPPLRKPSNQTTPSSSSISILQTPKPLAGRKILGTNDDNNDDNEQLSQKELVFLLTQSSLSITNIEEKYLKQILIGQERQENMIKILFENQKKKYKKPYIYVPLEEPHVEQPVQEKTFETKTMYKNPNDGNDVDLLSITGVKQKMNLYLTSLIDIVFTREELL